MASYDKLVQIILGISHRDWRIFRKHDIHAKSLLSHAGLPNMLQSTLEAEVLICHKSLDFDGDTLQNINFEACLDNSIMLKKY